jgi:single-strand DNA-binding protein
MKTITIAGNIGKDAQTRQAGQDNVTSFTVAVEDRRGQEKGTLWFDVSVWGKRGDALAQYLTKGNKVAVAGELSTREHEGKTYLTVRADQITLLGGSRDKPADPARQAPDRRAPAGGMDDEIPF